MIGCSEYCVNHPCCDFCGYAVHEEFFDSDGSSVIHGGPIGCELHLDEEHQEIVKNDGACRDFKCFRAVKPYAWYEKNE